MIDRIRNLPVVKGLEILQRWLTPAILRRRVFAVASIAIVGAVVYWGFVASDRYVSEAQVVVERTDMASSAAMDLGSLLTGAAGANRVDQLLLRAHLLSPDMLRKLDGKLNLRSHYSDTKHDILSRMWDKAVPDEWFHRYYLSRTSIEYDEYSGVLVIKAQGYDAKMANAIVSSLVDEGERFMNELGHSMAREQVAFLEKQVAEIGNQVLQRRREVLAFQNQKGLLSPQSTVETIQIAINQLEGQLTELKTKRSVMLGYLSMQAPSIAEIDMQIHAIEKQIQTEQSRLTSPSGKTLNSTVEEYQRVQWAAKFSEDVFKTALIGLEKGRIEAMRTLKKVGVLQAPTMPQYPLEPRRAFNILVFVLSALILAGIVHLLAAIIRDHQD